MASFQVIRQSRIALVVIARSVFSVVAAAAMVGCAALHVPETAHADPDVVSQDAQSWYILHSKGTPEHPQATSDAGWTVSLPTNGYLRYLQTPYRATRRPQTIVMSYRIVVSEDAIPISYDQDASPCREHHPCTPVAEFHIFFEQLGDDFTSESGRWWYKPGFRLTDTPDASYTAQPFVADGQPHTVTAPLTRTEWTSVTDRGSSADFEAALMNAEYVGVTFGGSDFFAQGVFVRQGTVQFEIIDFHLE